MYKFLKLVTVSANYHYGADPHAYWRHWWRTFRYEWKLSQETKSTGRGSA